MLKKLVLILRILVSVLLLQTLFYKFTAHPDSVYIFTQIGMEPYGRVGIGILELITAILFLFPKLVWLGSVLSIGIISGAILMHFTLLGIEINNDGGSLFYIALIVLVLSIILLIIERKNIPIIRIKL